MYIYIYIYIYIAVLPLHGEDGVARRQALRLRPGVRGHGLIIITIL